MKYKKEMIFCVVLLTIIINIFLITGQTDDCSTAGDSTGEGVVDIADPINLLNWLFRGGAEPSCLSNADANGDGNNDLSDAIYLLRFLFLGGPAPVSNNFEPIRSMDLEILGTSPGDDGIPELTANIIKSATFRMIHHSQVSGIADCRITLHKENEEIEILDANWIKEPDVEERIVEEANTEENEYILPDRGIDMTTELFEFTIEPSMNLQPNTEYMLRVICHNLEKEIGEVQVRVNTFIEAYEPPPLRRSEITCRENIDTCCFNADDNSLTCIKDRNGGIGERYTCEELTEAYRNPDENQDDSQTCADAGGVCCICREGNCRSGGAQHICSFDGCNTIPQLGPGYAGVWTSPQTEEESSLCDNPSAQSPIFTEVPVSQCNERFSEGEEEQLSDNRNKENQFQYLQNNQEEDQEVEGWQITTKRRGSVAQIGEETCFIKKMEVLRNPGQWERRPRGFRSQVDFYTTSELESVNDRIMERFSGEKNFGNMDLKITENTEQYNRQPLGDIEGWEDGTDIQRDNEEVIFEGLYTSAYAFMIKAELELSSILNPVNPNKCPEMQFAQSTSEKLVENGQVLVVATIHRIGPLLDDTTITEKKEYMYTKEDILYNKGLRQLEKPRDMNEFASLDNQLKLEIGIVTGRRYTPIQNPEIDTANNNYCIFNGNKWCNDDYIEERTITHSSGEKGDIKKKVPQSLASDAFTMSGPGFILMPAEIGWHDTPGLIASPIHFFVNDPPAYMRYSMPTNLLLESKKNFIAIIEDSHPIQRIIEIPGQTGSQIVYYYHRWVCELNNIHQVNTRISPERVDTKEEEIVCKCYQQRRQTVSDKWKKIDSTEFTC